MRGIGFAAALVFETKKHLTPRKESSNRATDNTWFSPASLKAVFEKEETEFGLDLDTSDMPDLEILEDNIDGDNSIPKLLAWQKDDSSSGSSINLLVDQKDLEDKDDVSDATEGAKFIIELKQTIL